MSERVNKKMLFYFYAKENFENSPSNRIHINCIKHYAHIFNEIKIVISVDDLSNSTLIQKVKKYFIENLPCLLILTFVVMENNPYYECSAFKDELLINEKNYEGLIFFAHNKGTTNYDGSKKALDIWITGLYFLSLEFCDEVETFLCANKDCFYGPYLMNNKIIPNKYHVYYTGTFFWLNLAKHIKQCTNNKIDYLLPIDARGWAEEYCGYFYDISNGLKSHYSRFLLYADLYSEKHAEEATKFLCVDEETWEKYLEFKNKMISNE